MTKKYYAMEQMGTVAQIMIYGTITSWPWQPSDVSAFDLVKEIDALEVDTIDVYINSYGGEIGEGIAIFNALKRHKARVNTFTDGVCCSTATAIFMAGERRCMYDSSLFNIHHIWQNPGSGNANDLRKCADDLDTWDEALMKIYLNNVSLSEKELTDLLDQDRYMSSEETLEKGFATEVIKQTTKTNASGNSFEAIRNFIMDGQMREDSKRMNENKQVSLLGKMKNKKGGL